MSLPTHPHRLSYSEMERHLYITENPLHAALFGDPDISEPGKNMDLLMENDYFKHKAQTIALNEKALKEEIQKLSTELGYLPVSPTKDQVATVTPSLNTPKTIEKFKETWKQVRD